MYKQFNLSERINIKSFLNQIDNVDSEKKKTLISINGKYSEIDTDSIKEVLQDFKNNDGEDIKESSLYTMAKDNNRIINVIRNEKGYIVNGFFQTSLDIINNGLYIYGNYVKLLDIPYLILNNKHKDTDEIIKYFTYTDKIEIDKKITKLDQALNNSFPILNKYKKVSNTGSRLKASEKDRELYGINLDIEEPMAIIDDLFENFITIDYHNLCFIRGYRYPVKRSKVKDKKSILENIKFPYMCTDWVCGNLHKHYIENSSNLHIYKTNDLIPNGKDFTRVYNTLTLEESLVSTLFNFDTMMTRCNGFSFIDLPIVYEDGSDVVNTKCRFLLLHGFVKSTNIQNEERYIQIARERVDNNINSFFVSYSYTELVSKITSVLCNDIIIKKIIELYNNILEDFLYKVSMFKDHVITFDTENTNVVMNIKQPIYMYRYLEAQESLCLEKDDEMNSDELNNYILSEENTKRGVSIGTVNIFKKEKALEKVKENKMKKRGVMARWKQSRMI